jgi:membrane protein DedA with SNARE-associated domain
MLHFLNPSYIALWIATWGYLGIAVFVFVGNLGVPVPEETVVLAAGFLAGRDILDPRLVFAVALGSAISGDCFGYLIGRTGGQRLLEQLAMRFKYVARRHRRFKQFFAAHGNKTVFFARFVPGLRFMAGPMAGAAGMGFWRFLGWNVSGATVWCGAMVTLGYLVGDEWEKVAHLVHRAGGWLLVALVVMVVVLSLWWRERPRAARRVEF